MKHIKTTCIGLAVIASVIILIMLMTTVSNAYGWRPIEAIDYEDGWLFDPNSNTLVVQRQLPYSSTYEVPWAAYLDDIQTVKLCYGITRINERWFYNCSNLRAVYLPNTLKEIGYYAFKDCTKLTSVVIPYGTTIIGWCAFDGCSSLRYVYIPSTVTYIYDMAFARCEALKHLTLYKGIEHIGSYAIDQSNVTSITFYGSYADWTNIDFGYHSECFDNVYMIYCWWPTYLLNYPR